MVAKSMDPMQSWKHTRDNDETMEKDKKKKRRQIIQIWCVRLCQNHDNSKYIYTEKDKKIREPDKKKK